MTDLDVTVVLSDPHVALVDELRTIRDSIKVLKAREKQIRTSLLKELKDRSLGVTASGHYIIEVDRFSRRGINSDRLQALYEDVYEDCKTETTVETLRLVEEDDDTLDFD